MLFLFYMTGTLEIIGLAIHLTFSGGTLDRKLDPIMLCSRGVPLVQWTEGWSEAQFYLGKSSLTPCLARSSLGPWENQVVNSVLYQLENLYQVQT